MKLLDHGYLELIETWGSDERIIESARMSTDGAFRGWGPTCDQKGCSELVTLKDIYGGYHCRVHGTVGPVAGDEKLLKYLWDNAHATPFEMCGLTFEVKAPIMVYREWHRHRIPFGYNELSARYAPLPNENYVPTLGRLLTKSSKNKQAGTATGADELTDEAALRWLDMLEQVYEHAERVYQVGLKAGVPKELARLPVPVARYSRMRATGNLRGWLAFLKLRAAPQAQWEIRQFANGIAEIIKHEFPRTYMVSAESLGLEVR
jgi:thymidylate synthase (FAD)